MFCPQCGNSVDSSMNFCPYCSYSIKNIKKSNQSPNTNDPPPYSNHNGESAPPYQREQNLPSFERYRQKMVEDTKSTYNNQDQAGPSKDYHDKQEYNPFYNPYNDGNSKVNFDNKSNPNKSQNSQNDYFDYPQSGYANNSNNPNYSQEEYNQTNPSRPDYNDSRNNEQNNYYEQAQYQEPRYNQNTSNQRQQENAKRSSGGSFGKNIYSTKNQRNTNQNRQNSPLLPPDDYQPEETFQKGRERNLQPSYDEEEDLYDYEQRQSSQPRFYNRGWFIALMIVLVLLAAAVLMHFLNIIDLTKIPQYVNNIISGDSTAEESSLDESLLEESENSLNESSQEESPKESSEESSGSSSVEAGGINDKKFYIDAKDIEQKHKDKVFKLDEPIEIDGITYTISIDDNENIKSESDEYVILNLAIVNSSGKTLMVNPFYFTLIDGESNIYYPSFKESNSIPIEEIETNKKLNGKISYKVPQGLTTLYIAFSNSENLDLAEFFIKYR